MNIGIISNKSHAKSHAAALRKKGHKVQLLGGNPRAIPPSLDALVCRPASVAHGGFHSAMAAKKRGMRVIIANGVSEVVRAVEGPPEAEVESLAITNAASALEVLSRLLGCYGSPLHDPSMGQVVSALAALRGDEGQLGFRLWTHALSVCKKDSVRNRAKAAAEEGMEVAQWVYSYPPRGAVRQLSFFVTDPEALGVVLSQTRLAGTREAAESQKLKHAKKQLPIVQPMRSQKKVSAPPQPAPKKAEAKTATWDAQLQEAIALLLSEMKEVGIEELTVQRDGNVTFTRVQIVTGSMTVAVD